MVIVGQSKWDWERLGLPQIGLIGYCYSKRGFRFDLKRLHYSFRCNLVRHRKLNYSITDVQWHPNEENLIASAAGNGAVILWDLTKENNKQEQTLFQQHRFVNRLIGNKVMFIHVNIFQPK